MDFRGDVDVYCCWNRFVYLVGCCYPKEAALTLPYLLTQTNLNRFALGRVFCAIDISDRCARVKLNTHFMLMSLISVVTLREVRVACFHFCRIPCATTLMIMFSVSF